MNNPLFREKELDGVMAIHSLEWTEQPLCALQNIRKIIKPGGYAVLAS
ncbi:methyltransferase domain-containing protein [Siminovitchia sp. FSL W7-1587]